MEYNYSDDESYGYESEDDVILSNININKIYTLDVDNSITYNNIVKNNSEIHIIGKYYDNINEYLNIRILEVDDGFMIDGVCDNDYNLLSNNIYTWILKDSIRSKDMSLNNIVNNIKDVIVYSTQVCMMCKNLLPCNVSRPMVCDNDTCVYQLSELGLGYSLEYYVLNSLDVLRLLVDIYISTIKVNKDKYFVDKPSFVDDKLNSDIMELSIDKLVSYAESKELRKYLYDINKNLYTMLQWIVSGNRCYIEKNITSQISGLDQYTIKSLSPEKEIIFNNNAKIHGSKYLFHGSSLFSWHSIIRNGLKIFSKTKYQVNGAAYGEGIYFSKNFNTAMGYSSKSNGIKCMAVCEVVDRYKESGGGFCTVVTREEDIKLKYLFVGSGGNIDNIKIEDIK